MDYDFIFTLLTYSLVMYFSFKVPLPTYLIYNGGYLGDSENRNYCFAYSLYLFAILQKVFIIGVILLGVS